MDGRKAVELSDAQRRALQELARSPTRAEADRARSILRSADGEASTSIAPTLGVRADQVRFWRMRFRAGGVEALRARRKTGRRPVKASGALPIVRQILAEPAPPGVVWTVPRLSEEVARRMGSSISASWLGAVMREKGGFAGVGRGTRSRAGRMWVPSRAVGCD